ncbi:MAG: hypothetical protein ACKPJ4_08215, partial [Dolichospermum sp.]
MEKLTLSKISKADLKKIVHLEEQGIDNYDWLNVENVTLNESEQQQLYYLQSHLLNYSLHFMNEATIWARGIYPFLLLAEQGKIQAWSEVPLQAKYPNFELEGIADGVLAKTVSDSVEVPYLVVVEAKKGLENQSPLCQLYGQLLTVAHLNWEEDQQDLQEIYGCYTIADVWTFIRTEIEGINAEKPTMKIEFSREYSSKIEGQIILR